MNETLSQIADGGVVAVLRGVDADQLVAIAEALQAGGVDVVEITADTPAVTDLIETLTDTFDDLVVGTGTVLDAETAQATIAAGASLRTEVMDLYRRNKAARLGYLWL